MNDRELAAMKNVVEAAHGLIGVTTHSNVTGPAYEERKASYALLRKQLANPALRPVLIELGLVRR